MSLQGFYTTKGLTLAAKIAAGTKLTITKVTAGSGETAKSAATLAGEKQTLTAGTAAVSGQTAVLPVTLAEAGVFAAYSLTELGVYAQDPDAGEILYQVFRMDTPVPLTAGGKNAYRFYLKQTMGAAGITVTCSPAGLLIDEDLAPVREKVFAQDVPGRTVSVAAEALAAYMDALPKLLTEQLTISVAGTLENTLVLEDFYGSGSLTVAGSSAAATLHKGVIVRGCTVPIVIKNCTVYPSEDSGGSCIKTSTSSNIRIIGCSLMGNTGSTGLDVDSAMVVAGNISIKNQSIAAAVSGGSVLCVYKNTTEPEYSNNDTGVFCWYGGAAILCDVPDTLGGTVNQRRGGGIIAVSDGTLI